MPPRRKSGNRRNGRSAGGASVPPTLTSVAAAFNTWIPFSLATLASCLGQADTVETYSGWARMWDCHMIDATF